jgi:hypothetical protein
MSDNRIEEKDGKVAYVPVNVMGSTFLTTPFFTLSLRNILESVALTLLTFLTLFGMCIFITSYFKYIPIAMFTGLIFFLSLFGIRGESLLSYLFIKSGLKKGEKELVMKMPDVVEKEKGGLLKWIKS